MKKRVAILVLAIALLAGFAYGEGFSKNGMMLAPGNSAFNAGVGYGYGWGSIGGINITAGYEMIFGKFDLGAIPLSFGAAARLGIGISSPLLVSAGAFGTLHFCWGALDLPSSFLNNLETYLGIGLGMSIVPAFTLGFNTIGGLNYFISDSMAVNFEGGMYSSTVGVLLKL